MLKSTENQGESTSKISISPNMGGTIHFWRKPISIPKKKYALKKAEHIKTHQ